MKNPKIYCKKRIKIFGGINIPLKVILRAFKGD